MLISDPLFYLTAIPAVLLYGMAKGGLGGAAGAIAVPLMALAINPVQAAAILLPIICVMDYFALKTFWKTYDIPSLRILLPASLVGVVIGSILLGTLSVNYVKLLVGLISVSFCVNYWVAGDKSHAKMSSNASGYFWGLIGGFTSTQIHAGGPPVSVYLLSKKLDKFTLIGTLAVFFAVLNFVKLIPYTLLGQFDAANLLTSLVLAPLAPIGVRAGYLALKNLDTLLLYRILYFLLFFSGLKLLIDAAG